MTTSEGATSMPLSSDDILNGHHRIEAEIGRGAYGRVAERQPADRAVRRAGRLPVHGAEWAARGQTEEDRDKDETDKERVSPGHGLAFERIPPLGVTIRDCCD